MAGKTSLAALYRPQTFAEVVGQDMVKSVLSRASREDRVAPAYLLSGTRGVGKTTIARIFAKALNCAHAPAGEPCNQCSACRRITQGSFVDVVEIDGASNRGIDDIRRLRDAVGYAPLEGRYKVFIIDEAHMLTKEAFNALLKTLEEPPARVTFIMATTEQHKFPVTILSRCQHFVFRQIPEDVLRAHVCRVLEREGQAFEPEAAALIARRAAGSVRDAMSLLGQALALGCAPGEPLTAAQVREVLGLAGREIMDRLLEGIAAHDMASIVALVRELLAQGVDMGFFLRELAGLWRDLFLASQAGSPLWPEEEQKALHAAASRFSPAFIHAAWQMTLDSQRRILTSLEPSVGLELLLLNLAMLPRLLPLRELAAFPAGESPPEAARVPAAERAESAAPQREIPALREAKRAIPETPRPAAEAPQDPVPPVAPDLPKAPPATAASPVPAKDQDEVRPSDDWKSADPDPDLHWESFVATLGNDDAELNVPMLRQCGGEVRGGWLVLKPYSQIASRKLQSAEGRRALEDRVAAWAGRRLACVFLPAQKNVRTEAELIEEVEKHPVVQRLTEAFGARVVHVKD